MDPTTHTAFVADFGDGTVSVIAQLIRASVTAVSPDGGPTAGVQQVTIIGRHFTGATRVLFGSTPATDFTVESATRISAITPAHVAGTVEVRVHTTDLSVKNPGARYHYS